MQRETTRNTHSVLRSAIADAVLDGVLRLRACAHPRRCRARPARDPAFAFVRDVRRARRVLTGAAEALGGATEVLGAMRG